MSHRTTWTLVLGISLAVAISSAATMLATPASGFTGSTLSVGRFAGFEVFNRSAADRKDADPLKEDKKETAWMSWQRVKGASDLYIQSNVWAPGGTTGWHSHPGHSLITVTAGTVTVYEGDDPSCAPHQYTAGMGFVDEGGDHVHVIRNEGQTEARTMAVQLIPAGAARRIDAEGNPHCPF